MPLDTLNSPSNFTGRMRAADTYDPNEWDSSRENYKRRRIQSASLDALLRRADPAMNEQRERVADIQDANDEMYDLEYREPQRAQMKGDIKRREAGFEAGAEQDRYFAQEPMRRDKEATSMRALRERYTDPAMIRGEADVRREVERGRAARDVAGITGGSRERQEATQQFGDVTSSQVLGGDREAGAAGRSELQGRMGPPKTATVGGPRGLQAYADAQGISLDDAIAMAQKLGYAITD